MKNLEILEKEAAECREIFLIEIGLRNEVYAKRIEEKVDDELYQEAIRFIKSNNIVDIDPSEIGAPFYTCKPIEPLLSAFENWKISRLRLLTAKRFQGTN